MERGDVGGDKASRGQLPTRCTWATAAVPRHTQALSPTAAKKRTTPPQAKSTLPPPPTPLRGQEAPTATGSRPIPPPQKVKHRSLQDHPTALTTRHHHSRCCRDRRCRPSPAH